jgi:hypothetical protein
MKHFPIFFLMFFSLQIVKAQNVGIGTTTPTQKLHVAGNGFIRDSVGIGVATPQYKLEVGGRMRIRSGGTLFESAGVWLNNNNNALAAFIGMANDDEVGFYGNVVNNFGMRMSTSTGNLGIGTGPTNEKLTVNGNINVSGRIINEAPTQLIPINNWTPVIFPPFSHPTYFKDKQNIVHFSGTVVYQGTNPPAIIILPVGYRPVGRAIFAVPNNTGFARIDIDANGTMDLGTNGLSSPIILSLDGISFYAP